jgi:hypothetical protein
VLILKNFKSSVFVSADSADEFLVSADSKRVSFTLLPVMDSGLFSLCEVFSCRRDVPNRVGEDPTYRTFGLLLADIIAHHKLDQPLRPAGALVM